MEVEHSHFYNLCFQFIAGGSNLNLQPFYFREVKILPYIHFTGEQKRQANLVDLSEFLRSRGEPLIQSGRELRMGSNHSVTVRGNNQYNPL